MSEEIEVCLQEIKNKFLSNTNFPKLIIGSGLSINYSIPGMAILKTELINEMPSTCKAQQESDEWKKICDKFESTPNISLEDALVDIHPDLVSKVSLITANLLIDHLSKNIDVIYDKDTGFKKLIKFLSNSCSTNNKVIDIMTPNYDLIIELISDNLGIHCIDGFEGSVIGSFDSDILDTTSEKYHLKKKYSFIRLFKPHGSINWLNNKNGKTVKVNDFEYLKNNAKDICIVTPGGSKYEVGLTKNHFRFPRESFSKSLANDHSTPIIVYGYGFNDTHLNAIFTEQIKHKHPLLVVSKSLSSETISNLMESSENVVFFEENNKSKMVYKSEIIDIEYELWNLDILAEKIIS